MFATGHEPPALSNGRGLPFPWGCNQTVGNPIQPLGSPVNKGKSKGSRIVLSTRHGFMWIIGQTCFILFATFFGAQTHLLSVVVSSTGRAGVTWGTSGPGPMRFLLSETAIVQKWKHHVTGAHSQGPSGPDPARGFQMPWVWFPSVPGAVWPPVLSASHPPRRMNLILHQ